VHAKAAVVLMIIMQYYSDENLEKLSEVLPHLLKNCLTNASPECRQIARKAFLIWQKIDQGGFHALYSTLEPSVQRAICDDAESFEVMRASDKARRPVSRAQEVVRKIPMSPAIRKDNS